MPIVFQSQTRGKCKKEDAQIEMPFISRDGATWGELDK